MRGRKVRKWQADEAEAEAEAGSRNGTLKVEESGRATEPGSHLGRSVVGGASKKSLVPLASAILRLTLDEVRGQVIRILIFQASAKWMA